MSTVAAVATAGPVMAGAPISCQDATGTADLRRVVGLADLCELLAITFAFPADDGLAAALASGTYLSDATGCLADAGYPASQVQDACRKLETFVGRDVTELAQDLRRGHSLLFLSPGSQGPVWPYEGAFRFAATGTAEAPSLFRSPVTLRVEKTMGEAGLLPTTAHTEPVDSVWGELEFLSQLYGRAAQAAAQALTTEQGSTNSKAAPWHARAAAFAREHVALWLPDFMERTRCRAEAGGLPYGTEYAALARFGTVAVQVLIAGNR